MTLRNITPRKKHLRVLSYNIHKGFSSGNRRFVLEKIRTAIREVHADLVFLQEVLGEHETHRKNQENWPENSQFEYLADQIWPHFAYGKNAVYSAGHHGNAILSKYPITFWENIDVSTNKLERRGLLHAKIELPESDTLTGSSHAGPGGTTGDNEASGANETPHRNQTSNEKSPRKKREVHAVCVHLGLRESDRSTQVQRLCERIDSHVPHGEALVIAGDFNDWRGRVSDPLAQSLETKEAFQEIQGSHARSFPSWLPALRLDRVYYRGLDAKNAELLSNAPWNELSDHAALYVELTMRL